MAAETPPPPSPSFAPSPAYSAETFRAHAAAVCDVLARHLERADEDALVPVLPPEDPAAMCARFPADFPAEGTGDLLEVIERVLASSTALAASGFVGHQVATPLPDAALCDLVAALSNNSMAIYEMGPAATAMERAVLQHFASALGFGESAGGVLTSGGSLGNLTALAAARQANAGFDAWRRGLRGGPQLVVLVARTAHYSVARAAHLLGLGDAGIIDVDVDERLRMKPEALEAALLEVQKKKQRPIAVVASAGSTAAGAIDPLDAIADICERHGVWLHVDGAHGAPLALSPTHRPKLFGIERADSVILDGHKLMAMPALVTALLFKDGAQGARAFSQAAAYLFDEENDGWADVGRRTVECTKRMMSLKLYACLRAYGTRFFAEHVDRCCALATALAAAVKRRPRLELLTEPEANIVCFRVRGLDGGQQDAIRRAILAEGRFYLVKVRLGPELWLRTTLASPRTTPAHLEALLDDVERHAAAML